MAAQRFTGTTVKEVLLRVRESLGADAVIVEQHQEQGQVVVVACTELHEAEALITVPETQSLSLSYRRQLLELGFDESYVDQIKPKVASLRGVLESLLEQVPLFDLPLSGRWQFIGPHGAGRTSAVIKLGSDWLAQGRSAKDLLFITTDVDRMGGTELLQSAAQALGVNCLALPAGEVNEVLRERSETLVLVDREAQCRSILGGVSSCLVMPSTFSRQAMQRVLQQLVQGPHALFVTQVDNLSRWGEWIGTLSETGLPIGWIGNSSNLPDGFQVASSDFLRDALISQIENFQTTTTFN